MSSIRSVFSAAAIALSLSSCTNRARTPAVVETIASAGHEQAAHGERPAVCLPDDLRANGAVRAAVRASGEVSFCLTRSADASHDVRACFDFTTALGSYAPAPPAFEIAPREQGGWQLPQQEDVRVTSTAREITVCTKTVGCNTLTPEGFRGAGPALPPLLRARMPATANEDGSRVFVVRHEGGVGESIFGEMYDAGAARRIARFAIHADGHVDAVAWVGRTLFLIACVDHAASCKANLLDPLSGGVFTYGDGPLDAQVYGIDTPLVYVRDGVWALVSRTGVSWVNMADGARLRRLSFADDAGPTSPIAVARTDEATLALVSSAPWAGRIRLVGLRSADLRASYLPMPCDDAGSH